MRGVIAALVALAALTAAAASPARPSGIQHVTLIGDSVADAIPGDDSAVAILRQGIDLDLEVAPCRRVEGDGCPYQGVSPPSAVQLVQTMGSKLGDTVIVAVGYNDFEDQYAGNIEDAINALTAAGVKRIFWLTLRAARHPYLTMNDDITQAAARHSQVSVVDWNVYSRSHPDWFQTDGLHLLGPGADAMATLIHKSLLAAGVAAKPARIATTALPAAHRGKAYRVRLAAVAGIGPYRWSLLERAPAGIHLAANGIVSGTPRAKAGRYRFDVRVRDTLGSMATRRLTLRIIA
jgi:sirohydrochlorin ferrochelatase